MVAETVSLKISRAAMLTRQTAEGLYARLRKEAGLLVDAAAEEIADALMNLSLKDRAILEQLRAAFIALFENLTMDAENAGTTNHDE